MMLRLLVSVLAIHLILSLRKNLSLLAGCLSVFILLSQSAVMGQWTTDLYTNTPVCTSTGNQESSQAASDGSGGVIIVWQDKRNGTDYNIYAQRLDASGNPQWTVNGIGVCTEADSQKNPRIISDNTGGAIITWEDYRNGAANSDIYAQRINPSGVALWLAGGEEICTAASSQNLSSKPIVSDGSNGAFITWYDYRNGYPNIDIYVQGINSSGGVLSGDGLPVCTIGGGQSYPTIASDNSGGAIITWNDSRFGVNDIYAQRINSLATPQWTPGGVVICNAFGNQQGPVIVGDGNGGAYIGWEDFRNSNYDIYAQHILSDSTRHTSWPINGLAICDTAGTQYHLDVATDPITNDVVITWEDSRFSYVYGSNSDIYAQRVTASAAKLWPTAGNGLRLSNTNSAIKASPSVVCDQFGNTYIAWTDRARVKLWPSGSYYFTSSDIKIQRIDPLGYRSYNNIYGNTVSGAAGYQLAPKLVDGDGGVIISWYDERGGSTNRNIYAQSLAYNGGTLSNPTPPNTSWQQVFPFPTGNSLFDVHHVTDDRVIAVGGGGVMLISDDGGDNWSHIYKPAGVEETFDALAFKDALTGIAVGEQGTIIRTIDGGENWEPVLSGTSNDLKGACYVSGDSFSVVGTNGTILLSANDGASWNQVSSGTAVELRDVDFGAWDAGVAIGDTSTIFRSTNGGATWSPIVAFMGGEHQDVEFYDSQNVYLVGDGALWWSGNAGAGWVDFTFLGTEASYPKHFWSVLPLASDTIIVGAEYHLWKLSRNPWPNNTINPGIITLYGDSGKDMNTYSLSTDGSGNIVAVGSGGMIFVSADEGDDWTEIGDPKIGVFNGISFIDSTRGWVTGGNQGIFKTSNAGKNWSPVVDNVPNWPNPDRYAGNYHGYGVNHFFNEDSGYISGDLGKIIHTTDGGDTWFNDTINSSENTAIYYFDMDTGIVVGAGGGSGFPDVTPSIYRTTDRGVTWTETENMLGATNGFLYDVFFLGNTGWACGAIGAWPSFTPIVFTSTDRGVTWSTASITTDISNGGFLAISFLDANTGYAVGFEGTFSTVSPLVMKTTDGGSNWVTVSQPYESETGIFHDIAFSNGLVAYVVGGSGFDYYQTNFFRGDDQGTGYMMYSTDAGSNWNTQSVPSSYLRHVTITQRAGGEYVAFAAGAGVVCASTMPLNVKTWTGTLSTNWNDPGNWSPNGIPLKFDNVVIPNVTNDPTTDDNIIVGSLTILSDATLTIDPPATHVIIKDGYYQYGDVVDNVDKVTMAVGGDFKVEPGGGSLQYPKNSANNYNTESSSAVVYKPRAFLNGIGEVQGSFDNLVIDVNAAMKSSANIEVENQCVMLQDFNLRAEDTLVVLSTKANAILGEAKIARGAVKRAILENSVEPYRFESDKSYVQFNGSGVYPDAMMMRARPDEVPRSFSLYWEAVECTLDNVNKTVRAENVNQFSRWAFGAGTRPNVILSKSYYRPVVRRLYDIKAVNTVTNKKKYTANMSPSPAKLQLRYDVDEIDDPMVEDSLVLLRGPIVIQNVAPRWNMVSLPVLPEATHKDSVFPTATSNLWEYENSYQSVTELVSGKGYWAKFSIAQEIPVLGDDKEFEDILVSQGWNLIGMISYEVNTSQLITDPPGILSSSFFGYEGGYQAMTTLKPMRAFWIKANAAGTIRIDVNVPVIESKRKSAAEVMNNLNKFEIEDADGYKQVLYFGAVQEGTLEQTEMPPRPPLGIFDARYLSNTIAELADAKEPKVVPLVLTSAKYPVKIRWTLTNHTGTSKLAVGSKLIDLTKDGITEISDASTSISLRLTSAPEIALPHEYALEQNFPNPFNPATTIKYQLPSDSKVTLRIYNILGQEVVTLADEVQEAGYKSVDWNGENLASGVYFYRLDATNVNGQNKSFTQVKKMILIK